MFVNKKVAFYTLGCKLNFSETSTIGRQLAEIGFSKTEFENKADLYVINTCSVTENANRECRRIIRKAKRTSPEAFIVVTGCFAQLKPKEISDIEGVDMVLGANEKFNLPKLLTDLNTVETTKVHGCEINDLDYFSSYSLTDRTRSFMKIQDGCDYPCTYCTIPLARGKSRCDSIENIIANANDIADKGIKEIVITGVNIGEFKDKNDNRNFADLVKELDKVEGIERYRISSIEPNLISDDVIDLVKSSNKFMPHFHIPMQSGSDVILGRMKRRYQTKLYRNKIEKIVSEVNDVCIGADVIIGFPGETQEEFNKTLNFIKDLPLSYLHVFTYSERENTPAIDMDGIVSKSDRADRSKQLRILSNKLQRAFYEKYLNTEHTALFEQEDKDGFLLGFTDNYIKIKIPFGADYCRTKQQVKLLEIDDDGIMKAELL
ncbi:MAG: tRNA (N(6)-L-threonylcarbamoyladenosine(37)-C(2))-methylthiotransferase MtaB [Flavobacteriales bacterium]|jgi:threonylcarbamoyladenosine tRNA methylthiotransferase MtaB|nr:tRNA (N(6)-L-threonylcarbamoyladenosine(37)-C(2))-methylthiotransferase MtaB [Flavobacteriales bacterium]MDC3394730.1 tRNA (N(6)-L-threonylcarbamoyladenosine(37)-C(2))-methylthiotransferase MtaB [Flavobacteriales bacterium]MDG1349407.1 tRNA (N(6)-L-threonylcarbamoyladenosine(37)-C(2))-methylthiotransferase MtaB [Flavobacteriales bacterium]